MANIARTQFGFGQVGGTPSRPSSEGTSNSLNYNRPNRRYLLEVMQLTAGDGTTIYERWKQFILLYGYMNGAQGAADYSSYTVGNAEWNVSTTMRLQLLKPTWNNSYWQATMYSTTNPAEGY